MYNFVHLLMYAIAFVNKQIIEFIISIKPWSPRPGPKHLKVYYIISTSCSQSRRAAAMCSPLLFADTRRKKYACEHLVCTILYTVWLSKIILRLELICSDCDETGFYGKPMTHTSRNWLFFPSFSIISCDLLSSHARGKGVGGGSCFLAKVERARTKI